MLTDIQLFPSLPIYILYNILSRSIHVLHTIIMYLNLGYISSNTINGRINIQRFVQCPKTPNTICFDYMAYLLRTKKLSGVPDL